MTDATRTKSVTIPMGSSTDDSMVPCRLLLTDVPREEPAAETADRQEWLARLAAWMEARKGYTSCQ